jgi:hypothetical protein
MWDLIFVGPIGVASSKWFYSSNLYRSKISMAFRWVYIGFELRTFSTESDENRKLKKLLAETALDVATLRKMLGKNS